MVEDLFKSKVYTKTMQDQIIEPSKANTVVYISDFLVGRKFTLTSPKRFQNYLFIKGAPLTITEHYCEQIYYIASDEVPNKKFQMSEKELREYSDVLTELFKQWEGSDT